MPTVDLVDKQSSSICARNADVSVVSDGATIVRLFGSMYCAQLGPVRELGAACRLRMIRMRPMREQMLAYFQSIEQGEGRTYLVFFCPF